MLVYQIVILADNLEAGFFFARDIQSLTGDSGALDDETLQQDTQHFFLQAVGNGELVFHGFGNLVQLPALCFVQCEADKVGRTVEKEAAARHFVVVSIDTIEVAVEQQSHIFTIYGLKFKMLQMSQ